MSEIKNQKSETMKIRKATINDARAICNIYNYYVENTVATFETVPISESEGKQRINNAISSGHLFQVGEVDGKIIGFYCTRVWNNRSAYATTAEESIYLDKDETGKGYGAQLFEHLINNIKRTKIHTLIGCICLPNESSVRLHEKFGFKQVSHMKEVGRKFNQWLDIGHWQLIF